MPTPMLMHTMAGTESWVDVLLTRLGRLLELQTAHTDHLNGAGRRLLHRSIFATYVECREEGVGDAAGALLLQYSPPAA